MTTQYQRIPFVFASRQLATDIRASAQDVGLAYSEIDHLAGIGVGNTARLARNSTSNPKMSTWLSVCNALDLDPRDYFVLQE